MAHILVLYLKGLIYLSWFNNSSVNMRSLETKGIQVGIHFVQIPETSKTSCRPKFSSWPTINARFISLKTRCHNNFVGLKKGREIGCPIFLAFLFFWNPLWGDFSTTCEYVRTAEWRLSWSNVGSAKRCWELGHLEKYLVSRAPRCGWKAGDSWELVRPPEVGVGGHQWFQMHFTISFPHQNWIWGHT